MRERFSLPFPFQTQAQMDQLRPKCQPLSLPLHRSPGSCPLWGAEGPSADRQEGWQARQKSGVGKGSLLETVETDTPEFFSSSSAPEPREEDGQTGQTLPGTQGWAPRACRVREEPYHSLARTPRSLQHPYRRSATNSTECLKHLLYAK